MKKRHVWVASTLLSLGLVTAGITIAQGPPERNINPNRHPNLAAAQDLAVQAYNRVVAAQQGNDWDMDGHAQKAKELLDQASRELKAAAEAANHNHR